MSKCIVLMFHEINDVAWFERTLKFIGRKYGFVSFHELRDRIENSNLGDSIAHITFDDGHRSFYDNAFPVLKKLSLPSTLFVSPQVIEQEHNYWFQRVRPLQSTDFRQLLITKVRMLFNGDISNYSTHAILKSLPYFLMDQIVSTYENDHPDLKLPYMNVYKGQLIEMSDSGLVEIGAHTVNHPILANESDNDSAFEINDSIRCLNKLVNKPIRAFAYPNGQPVMDFGQREMKFLRDAGIELAFSTESRSMYNKADHMSIPRIGVSKGNPFFVTQKIRFAKQWIQLRNLAFRNTELKDRKQLLKIRKANGL